MGQWLPKAYAEKLRPAIDNLVKIMCDLDKWNRVTN
jgi:hypothetical protein